MVPSVVVDWEQRRPVNVWPRKGRRVRAQAGPCSVIWGQGVKKSFRVSVGGLEWRKAWQKREVFVRRREARAMVGEGH